MGGRRGNGKNGKRRALRERVMRRRKRRRADEENSSPEKNWPESQWKQKFHGVVVSDAPLCGERSVRMKAKLSLATRSLMTSRRRDRGGHRTVT